MPGAKQTNKEYADGLRARFARHGDADMTDTELLCLLLSFTNVSGRLCETVAELERHFGTARGCFHVRYADLMKIEGMTRHGAMLILLTGKLAAMRGKVPPVGRSASEYESMFSMMMRYSRDEELWAAALDDDDGVVAVERLASGEETQVGITVGCVMRFAAYHKARKVIIAHSHPGADSAEASPSDMHSLSYLGRVLDNAGITLLGQVIVSGRKARLFKYSPEGSI